MRHVTIDEVIETLPGDLISGSLYHEGSYCVLGWICHLVGIPDAAIQDESIYISDVYVEAHPETFVGHEGALGDYYEREVYYLLAEYTGISGDDLYGLLGVNDDTPEEGRSEAMREELRALKEMLGA